MTAYVLIPEAGGVAWYWHRVVPLLAAAGHEAIAVDLPGDDPTAGLSEYAAMTRTAIDGRRGVVVVAMSLGGATAALVTTDESPVDFDGWPPIPMRVVAGADDRFFPVEFQQRVARERLGVTADVLPGGHLIALSQPGALARYLLNDD